MRLEHLRREHNQHFISEDTLELLETHITDEFTQILTEVLVCLENVTKCELSKIPFRVGRSCEESDHLEFVDAVFEFFRIFFECSDCLLFYLVKNSAISKNSIGDVFVFVSDGYLCFLLNINLKYVILLQARHFSVNRGSF